MGARPLTRDDLITAGSCCGNNCQNCPYSKPVRRGNIEIEINCLTCDTPQLIMKQGDGFVCCNCGELHQYNPVKATDNTLLIFDDGTPC